MLPTFEQVLLALLTITKDETKQVGTSYNTERAIRNLSAHFEFSTEDKEIKLGNGVKVIRDLVITARDHLRGAGLIEGSSKNFSVTTTGKALLRKKPSIIDEKLLQSFPEYKAFIKELTDYAKLNLQWYKENDIQTPKEALLSMKKFIEDYNNNEKLPRKKVVNNPIPVQLNIRYSLEDQIDKLYQELNKKLREELLEKVKAMPPAMFEELSVAVISKLIYPDTRNQDELKKVGKTLGKTGDGGIDGIVIKKETFRETKYYVQCKRWKNTTIGEQQIRDFAGALTKDNSDTTIGIFITTSSFTKAAEEFIKHSKYKINLVDGQEFIQYMIDFDIGVQRITSYRVRTIDQEFFSVKSKSKTTLF